MSILGNPKAMQFLAGFASGAARIPPNDGWPPLEDTDFYEGYDLGKKAKDESRRICCEKYGVEIGVVRLAQTVN